MKRRLRVHDGILVSDDMKVSSPNLRERLLGIRQQCRLEIQVPHAAVPAALVAICREEDQPIAGQPLGTDRRRELAQLGLALEMSGRLQEAQRPARRQGCLAQQLRGCAQRFPEIASAEIIKIEGAFVAGEADLDRAAGISGRDLATRGAIEEKPIAPLREQ